MNIIKAKDYAELSSIVADIIENQIKEKKDSFLGLATGSSPVGTYEMLRQRDIDFSKVKTVNLDEYQGLSKDNNQSYMYFMNENLFKYINIDYNNVHIPNGLAKDLDEECERYNKLLEELGPRDIQILGIGLNGHIGFNEPNTEFTPNTHVVKLSKSTIDANSRFFENYEDVPKKAITMGIKNILDSKHIILIVNGKAKANILKEALYGPITPSVQASILQLHKNVTVVATSDALI